MTEVRTDYGIGGNKYNNDSVFRAVGINSLCNMSDYIAENTSFTISKTIISQNKRVIVNVLPADVKLTCGCSKTFLVSL
jgi:hypothetical protein